MSDDRFPGWHGTTIVAVRKGGRVVVAGDGQVSLGQTVIKGTARKVRRIMPGGQPVLCGFAGSTADAFTLLERLEKKLEAAPGQLQRAAVELAKDWRTDKYLRNLEAMLIVTDGARPSTSSPAPATCSSPSTTSPRSARAATTRSPRRARSTTRTSTPRRSPGKAMAIAAEICVYTNGNVVGGKPRCPLTRVAGSASGRRPRRDYPLLAAPGCEAPHMRRVVGRSGGELGVDPRRWSRAATARGRSSSSMGGAPVGYIQYWFVGHHQNAQWIAEHPWLAELPADAVGRRSFASAIAARLSQGDRLGGAGGLRPAAAWRTATGRIIIDPDPANAARGARLCQGGLPAGAAAFRGAPATC